ncbi:FAD:protein FMN transferase [Simplicispira hankyongi]|uniref:FAD:protein FMN transferase n=1 Tax=Simplicispira hankyongi TaxID=2315688 RepID=A0A398C961_9BURK|nr:FAD:protein FMN transferase [Simplicispira hankyongi]RID97627.1 FAD:protein FMN transferase [Simplicispira hankyongi]
MDDARKPVTMTRRRVVMALPLLGAAQLAGAGVLPTAAPALQRSARALMGTRVDMAVASAGAGSQDIDRAMDAAWVEMERLSRMMTRYDETSVVSAITRAAGKHAVAVPPEMMAILRDAQALSVDTHGAFDITVGALRAWKFGEQAQLPDPALIEAERRLVGYRGLSLDARAGTAQLARAGMALDLGGIAKLPILSAGMQVLHAHGVDNALINGGGDVLLAGTHHGKPWRVGLRDPLAPERMLGVLALQGQTIVASSGDYERFFMAQGERQHHILDPATGRPTHGPHGISLLARDVSSVNGLGAAMMVLGGERAQALIQQRPLVQALIMRHDGSVWRTPGMATALQAA